MFIEQVPKLFRMLYPHAEWRGNTKEKVVYLTFDDGPIPGITPWVLDLLDEYGIKATFFLVGDNVRKHPEEFRMIVERGHRVGNHTFNHIKGPSYKASSYVANVEKANELIQSDLFRPPHGWMGYKQYHTLRHRYRIIMWDLVTRDYSKWMTADDVLANVKRYARNGSIITFHDSLKSIEKLRTALPLAIEWLINEGYEFRIFD